MNRDRRFQAYNLAEVERAARRRERIEAALFPVLIVAFLLAMAAYWYATHPVVPA